ncbi:MAG: hypothetical protein K0U93_29245 [Gammaproteobacteria bacterium]|nr:hypothetical protein [Gammaproteobacteria bacterium]
MNAGIEQYWLQREHEFDWAPGSLNPSAYEYKVDFEMHIPYFDHRSGRFQMLMRFPPGEFGCPLHRHVAKTETFVLRGKQFVHVNANASHWRQLRCAPPTIRQAGTYDYSGGPEALPHLEHGGIDGALVLLAMQASADAEHVLFQYFNDDLSIRPATGNKVLSVANVVAATRRARPSAVATSGSNEVYETVCQQFGRR